MKKLITLLFMFCVLSACSSQKTEKLTCNISGTDDAIVIKNVYHYTVGEEESKLVKMESETVVTFNDTDLTKESQEALAQTAEKEFSSFKGIDYSYTVDDSKLTEKVSADLTTLTTSDLESFGMSIDPENAFDLEQFVSNQEVLGYTCE